MFALYLNSLLLGFFRWTTWVPNNEFGRFNMITAPILPARAAASFLGLSLWLFVILGLSLLRNRDVVRKRIGKFGPSASGWWAATWPAPYVAGAVLVVGCVLLAMIHFKLPPEGEWSNGIGIIEALVFAAWIARDGIYLQWMSLRRTRRPLVSGAF
jgi:hypothetical protein